MDANVKSIKKSFITFEQAKLLYNKGFRFACKNEYYNSKGEPEYCRTYSNAWKTMYEGKNPDIPRSEQWEVVQWLLDTYDIDVYVRPVRAMDNTVGYIWVIFECEASDISKKFDTKEEAYSEAINYILKELI